jgi:hypothetical protein
MPIAAFARKRGGLMPAILLARVTHRSGGLHVSTESSDFSENAQDSQGFAVLGRYRNALEGEGAVGKSILAEEAKVKKAPTQPATGTPATSPVAAFQAAMVKLGPTQVTQAIRNAMRSVYRWMYYDVMEPALRRGLADQEIDYYNELAEAASKPDRLAPADVTPIAEEAKTNNQRIMKEAGFEV